MVPPPALPGSGSRVGERVHPLSPPFVRAPRLVVVSDYPAAWSVDVVTHPGRRVRARFGWLSCRPREIGFPAQLLQSHGVVMSAVLLSPPGSNLDVARRVESMARVDVSSLSASEARGLLGDISHVRQWMSALESSVISRMKEVAEPEIVAVDLAAVGRMNRGQVRGALERAETLDQFGLFAGALAQGQITTAHVDAVSRGLKTLGEEGAGLVGAESTLLEQACVLPADQFGRFVANEVERQSTLKANQEFGDQRRATSLKWWNNKQGMVRLSGSFDPERGALLVGRLDNAVEAMFHGPHGSIDAGDLAPGVEPNDHRRAVALLGLVGGSVLRGSCESFLADGVPGITDGAGDDPSATVGDVDASSSSGSSGDVAHVSGVESANAVSVAATRAEILVTVDLETLRSGVHGSSVHRTSTGAELPADVIRRMACEAAIVPVVLNGQGVVVDIGRARRLATRAQRQAIFAMHRTCAMPECSVRIAVCVPHHIDYWERGGATDLANLVPLCSRHHHVVHEGGWKLSISRDRTVTVVLPDGRTMSRPLRESSPRFAPAPRGGPGG